MNKKLLLIIGGGIEQVRAYELAREMGIQTVCSDMNSEAPGVRLADYTFIASTRDADETIREARKFNDTIRHIDGVMTLANDVPVTVARVAEELRLPGISVESARLASDKIAMKERFAECDVPIPLFQEVFSPEDVYKSAHTWGYPVVIKPNDSRGARGVLRLLPDTDHEWAFKHAMENSDQKRVLTEKFIEGNQLSTETMVYKGTCYTAAWSLRNYELIDKFPPYMIENGGTLPVDLSVSEEKEVEGVIQAVARSYGITDGIIKGDLVLSPDGVKVIEFAARLSGGYLATDQIPLARGVDLVKQSMKLALGERLDTNELVPQKRCYIGIRYFFPRPGRIIEIRGFDELDQLPWISKKMMFLNVGDRVENPANHTKRAGFLHATGDTFEEATERAKEAVKRVEIVTEK